MRENLESEPSAGPVLVPDQFGERSSFLAHLEELRRRLIRSFLWVGIGTAVSFRFSHQILVRLIQPVGQVVFLSPAEPFMVHLKAAFLGGIILSLPLLAWEVWGFLGPGLLAREKRIIFQLIPISAGLFAAGTWFGWKVLMPSALKFLLSFGSESFVPMITVGSYVRFAAWLIAGCGLIFQMPIVVLVLAQFKIIQPAGLLRQWRIAVVAILGLAAVLTPTPDVFTQLLLAAPMGVLYLFSVLVAFFVAR